MFLLEIIALGFIFIAGLYFGTNHLMDSLDAGRWSPETALDRAIPVIPWSIVPYLTLYLFYPATLICTPRNDRGRTELLVGLQAMLMMTVICVFFFVVFPTEVTIRAQLSPDLLNGEGWPGKLFAGLHSIDTAYNAWPSLHIAQSLFLSLAMTVWLRREHAHARWLMPALIFLWADWTALSVSILTTKQHYLWDLVTGGMVGMAFWRWHTKPMIRLFDSWELQRFSNPFRTE